MKNEDYFLKNILLDIMQGITHFEDKATGKDLDNETIKELLKDDDIKERFYLVLQNELIKALEKKYPELKGNI